MTTKSTALVEVDAALSLVEAANTQRPARIGLLALGLGFGGFLLWAGLAPLDEGVPCTAQVSIDTKRKAVQHLTGGLIKTVLVHEGQQVKEGQLLVTLDDAVATSNYQSVRQRYLSQRTMQSRLQAEQSGQASISVHPDVQAAASDPLIQAQMGNQQLLLQSRRSALQADLQAITENIHGQEAQLKGFEAMLIQRRSQLSLINTELSGTRDMVKEGYVPRNRQLELERMVADTSATIADLQANLTRTQRAIAEVRQRGNARQQEYRKEVETQLADVTRDVQADTEKVIALKADLARVEIKSPASGQVLGLSIQTVGGVLQAGQKLMDVVPEGEILLLEAKVAPNLIDKIHAGLAADIRFTAFAHSPQLVVSGKVASISSDLLSEPQNPQITYYLARIAITPEGLKTLGQRQLQPGMPAEVIIKTGERSMLTYLLHPLTKRMAAAMKEE